MRRTALTTAVLAALAAWASAQGPAPGDTAATNQPARESDDDL